MKMRHFEEYARNKDLAEILFESNIDADVFCEAAFEAFKNEEPINELWGAIQNIARGLGGLANVPMRAGADAASSVGRGLSRVGSAIGGAASAAGGYMKDAYQQGVKKQAINQIGSRIKGLENALIGVGLDQQKVSNYLNVLSRQLLKAVESGEMASVVDPRAERRKGRQDFANRLAGGKDVRDFARLDRQTAPTPAPAPTP